MQDEIQIDLTDAADYFISQQTNQSLHETSRKFSRPIRPQIRLSGALAEAGAKASDLSTNSARYMMVGGLALNLFTAGDTFPFFSFTRSLSLIVHLQMMNILFPAEVSSFMEKMALVVSFDILDFLPLNTYESWRSMFDFEKLDKIKIPLPQQAQDLAYNSVNTIIVLKTFSFMTLIYIAKVILAGILKIYLILTKEQYGGVQFYNQLTEDLFFKEAISITIEGLLSMFFSSFLTLTNPLYTKNGDKISMGLGYYNFFMSTVVLPCITLAIVLVKTDVLKSEQFKQVIGVLYEEMKLNTYLPKFYYFWFWFRRFIYVTINLSTQQTNWETLQFTFNCLLNLISLIFIGLASAHKQNFFNNLDLFNEFMIMSLNVYVGCFTDWISDKSTSNINGWQMNIMLCFFIFVNMIVIFSYVFYNLKIIAVKYSLKINNFFAGKNCCCCKIITRKKYFGEEFIKLLTKYQKKENTLIDRLSQQAFNKYEAELQQIPDKIESLPSFRYCQAQYNLQNRQRLRTVIGVDSTLVNRAKLRIQKLKLPSIDEQDESIDSPSHHGQTLQDLIDVLKQDGELKDIEKTFIQDPNVLSQLIFPSGFQDDIFNQKRSSVPKNRKKRVLIIPLNFQELYEEIESKHLKAIQFAFFIQMHLEAFFSAEFESPTYRATEEEQKRILLLLENIIFDSDTKQQKLNKKHEIIKIADGFREQFQNTEYEVRANNNMFAMIRELGELFNTD